MIAWIRRARQTRTQVDGPSAMQRERDAGLRLAFRVLGAMQLTTQLLLWTIQFGYDHLRQTTWQAAVFLTVPTLLLWLLWRRACRGGLEGGRRYWALLLIPNLCMDAYLCMLASNSLISDLIPAKTPLAWPLVVTFFPVVSSWLSRDKGAAYGAYTLRWLLAALVPGLCACQAGNGLPASEASPEITLPPAVQSYVAPIGDAALEYTADATLYLPRHSGGRLTAVVSPVTFSASRPRAESLVRALLNHCGFAVLEEEMINRDTLSMIVRKTAMPEASAESADDRKAVADCARADAGIIAPLMEGHEIVTAEVRALTGRLAREGKRLAMWGASHQGFTLASTSELGKHLAYIIDSAPFKQGRFAPASHVPIVPPEHYFEELVDAVLIVAPGYTDEIAGIIKTRFGEKVEIMTLRTNRIEHL